MSKAKSPSAWGIEMATFWLKAGMSFPVDVKLLAIEATKNRFSDPIGLVKAHDIAGIDGFLVKRKTKGDWCIAYDVAVESTGRTNFTLGHELGHYLLHRDQNDEFRCGQGEMLDYEGAVSKQMEAEANLFASFLLMPIDDFKKQIAGQKTSLDLFAHCADRYGTSFTATALKWISFTSEPAILVVAREGFVCWSYPSKPAKKLGIYLAHGVSIPQTADSNRTSLISSINYTTQVCAGVWHETLEAEESAIVSDRYDMTIFLVRFPSAINAGYENEEEDLEDSFAVLTDRAQGFNWKK